MSKYKKHLIIVGTARSGTSWLSEIIGTKFRYRLLFEPEHEHRTKNGHLLCDKLIITEEDIAENTKIYLKNIFENKVDCDWIGQLSNRRLKRHLWPFIPKKFIIKFVRANLSAGYINKTYNIPVIHIIRNPYDVIQSQSRVKFRWLTDLSTFIGQDKLVNFIMDAYNLDLKEIDKFTSIEKLTLRWCIENVVVIDRMGGYTGHHAIVRYEDLLENVEMFLKLCGQFNIEPRKDIREIYDKPSSKTHPKSNIRICKHDSNTGLSASQVQSINKILDVFNTKLYSRRNE